MNVLTSDASVLQNRKYFGPATVLDVDPVGGLVLLKIIEDINAWGRSAVPYAHRYVPGDIVLVAGDDINSIYVIGIINRAQAEGPGEERLNLKNGSYATVERTSSAEKLHICAESGELIFEYDPETGKSRVNIQSGDLEFVTGNGDINFISGRDINFESKNRIDMNSRYGLRLAISDTIGKIISSLSLGHKKIKLTSPEVGVSARRGELQIDESRYEGNTFTGTVQHIKLVMGRLETAACDVISKARNIYRTVECLTQLKTGRMRTLVNSTFHMKARKSYMKSEEDFKINAEKIHLG